MIERIKAGESMASVVRTLPFTVRTVYRWIARCSLGRFNNLKDRKKSGRPRKWAEKHAEWIGKVVVDQTPRQCKFEFALRTANRLRQAFYQEFGVRIIVWTLRRILKMPGLAPQWPERRAARCSRGDVRRWKDEEFPQIVKQAKELGASIVFSDESGLSSYYVYRRTWGVKGKTPVVRVASTRFRLNMFAAISPEGEIYCMLHEGGGTGEEDEGVGGGACGRMRDLLSACVCARGESSGTDMGADQALGQSANEPDEGAAACEPRERFPRVERVAGASASVLS